MAENHPDTNSTTDIADELRAYVDDNCEPSDMQRWLRRALTEIERLRALVRVMHDPFWDEVGPAAEDTDIEFADVLPNALKEGRPEDQKPQNSTTHLLRAKNIETGDALAWCCERVMPIEATTSWMNEVTCEACRQAVGGQHG